MNIILIGMPGAGKSTLGVLLAKALGMDFVDTDILIQQREGKLLQDIIDKSGHSAFLEAEESALTELKCSNSVVATGGSAVYSEKAMRALKADGVVLYLHADFREIEKRLRNIKTRGVVIKEGQSLSDVYEERLPLYRKYADAAVDCTNNDIEQSVNEIIIAAQKLIKTKR
jgi:shikimate kinase